LHIIFLDEFFILFFIIYCIDMLIYDFLKKK
jgi:hypothetical protein